MGDRRHGDRRAVAELVNPGMLHHAAQRRDQGRLGAVHVVVQGGIAAAPLGQEVGQGLADDDVVKVRLRIHLHALGNGHEEVLGQALTVRRVRWNARLPAQLRWDGGVQALGQGIEIMALHRYPLAPPTASRPLFQR